MIISGLEANKYVLRPTALFTNKAKWAFLITCTLCYNVLFSKAVFHDDVTYQHPLFVNNSNNNHYLTNYSKNNRSAHRQHL